MVRLNALKLREPNIMYEHFGNDGDLQYKIGYEISYSMGFKYIPHNTDGMLHQPEQGLPKLNSSDAWAVWKAGADNGPIEHDYVEAATFLYCALN